MTGKSMNIKDNMWMKAKYKERGTYNDRKIH